MMHPMFVPKSIRLQRFNPNKYSAEGKDALIKSLSYISQIIRRIVVSEKYITNPCIIALDVSLVATKQKIARAFASIAPENPVVKITSLIDKSTTRVFKGKIGKTKANKRVCIKFERPFDVSLLYKDEEAQVNDDIKIIENKKDGDQC